MVEWFIPAAVFFARILDVSIGTVRIILVIKGMKFFAATAGFFEVTIWVLAVSAVITNISDSLATLIAYGLGFAVGTLVGMWLEEKLALGSQLIRIVNVDASLNVAAYLREKGYSLTRVIGEGRNGPSEICFVVVSRRRAKRLTEMVYTYCPRAYVTVEDIRSETFGDEFQSRQPSKMPLWRRWVRQR
ncbi:MAG: DUF2179 domain-containing protein [Candidatus Sumerlaeia bacterium]|nr:DUF2179 domain-containing protein [Candidatus Sumerlaeia bacterium]